MPEIIIKYKSKRALQALKDFAKYFDYSIVMQEEKKLKSYLINGLTIEPANNSMNINEMEEIFSNRNIDAKNLRQDAWQRTK